MENLTIKKDSKTHGFKKGDSFMVKRNIMGECVVIIPNDNVPNVIMSEDTLRLYGNLTGNPQLCFS